LAFGTGNDLQALDNINETWSYLSTGVMLAENSTQSLNSYIDCTVIVCMYK